MLLLVKTRSVHLYQLLRAWEMDVNNTNCCRVLSRVGGPGFHQRLLDKIMIFQGVKPTIQPLGVRYANRPKKAKMGGYVAFSPIYACLALI